LQIALFITCLADAFLPRSGKAVVRVLEHLGHEVVFPEAQTCCGQPMFNAGMHHDARALARRMVRVFDGFETVVTPSGSCAAMVREHAPALFPEGSAERAAAEDLARRTFEFVEFLTRVERVDLAALGVRWEGSATYHYSCHGRGIGLRDEAAALARQVDGLDFRPLERVDQCCGFGGAFALKYDDTSGEIVRDKVGCIRDTGAAHVISNDAGCTMNIAGACRRAECDVRFTSLAEIIAEGLGLLDREAEA
jgi:L-lactate dehydrogenase complex protein LldE